MAFQTGSQVNNIAAGTAAADPILKDLGLDLVVGASTMDIATVTSAAIDQVTGAVQANIRNNLSPSYLVTTNGSAGSYNDTTKALTVSSTAGLGPGDFLEVSHPAINGGAPQPLKILAIVNGTSLTFVNNPFDGGGNRTGITYQTLWRFAVLAGAGGSVSSAGGTQNFLKFLSSDAAGNPNVLAENAFWVRDAPAAAGFISINAQDGVAGASGNTITPALNVLGGWTNRGGVVSLAWANHSVQARNDFKWGDGSTTEKTIGAALGANLQLTAGDGIKYGRLVLRGLLGGGVTVERDVAYTVDSTAPTIVMFLLGR